MRLSWSLPLLLASLLGGPLTGCVVKYGAPTKGSDAAVGTSASPTATGRASSGEDFSALEARIDALLSATEDLDERDRMMAALDFARMSRRLPPEAQRVNYNFLSTMLTIEERDLPYAAPVLTGGGRAEAHVSPVVEDPDPGETGATTPENPTPELPTPGVQAPAVLDRPDLDAMLASAREMLAAGDAQGAMAVLEPCRDAGCWDQVAATWTEARETVVFKAREAAGARYLESRVNADPEARRAILEEVRDTLADLVQRYPDSGYAEAIQRNLTLVEAELTSLGKP